MFETFRWNNYATNFDFIAPYYGLKYAGTSGNYIDNSVIQFGAFEKSELNLLRNIIEKLNSKDILFLDIGANTGLYSLFMSKYSKFVHSIEPFPPILDKLRNNINLNRIENITVHPVGFGAKDDIVPFFIPPTSNLGIGSFVPESEVWASKESVKLLLPIKNGDSFLQEKQITHVDIIKLDIEGYEKLALIGLKKTLENSRPFIVMELNTTISDGFHSMDDISSTFPEKYIFMQITHDLEGLTSGQYSLVPLHFSSSQVNILAYPEEQKALIESIQHSDRQL